MCPEPASDATENSGAIDEWFFDLFAEPERMDWLWERGWRHFGAIFFRYSRQLNPTRQDIIPLRIDLARFQPTKSQRRALRKNSDLRSHWGPVDLSAEHREVFARHAGRFAENVPQQIEDFVGTGTMHDTPCVLRELSVREPGGRLVAVSYVALGSTAWSSVYAYFDPADAARSLGIATQLWEIEAARAVGCRWLYLGYATRQPSRYDYKRQYAGAEWYDWERWSDSPIPRSDDGAWERRHPCRP